MGVPIDISSLQARGSRSSVHGATFTAFVLAIWTGGVALGAAGRHLLTLDDGRIRIASLHELEPTHLGLLGLVALGVWLTRHQPIIGCIGAGTAMALLAGAGAGAQVAASPVVALLPIGVFVAARRSRFAVAVIGAAIVFAGWATVVVRHAHGHPSLGTWAAVALACALPVALSGPRWPAVIVAPAIRR